MGFLCPLFGFKFVVSLGYLNLASAVAICVSAAGGAVLSWAVWF